MPSIFRDPIVMTFVDSANTTLLETTEITLVPSVGDNVRIGRNPYVVERVGYDIPERAIERIWLICRAI